MKTRILSFIGAVVLITGAVVGLAYEGELRKLVYSHAAFANSLVEMLTPTRVATTLLVCGGLLLLLTLVRRRPFLRVKQCMPPLDCNLRIPHPVQAGRSTKLPASLVIKRQQTDRADREFLPAALELIETPPSPIIVALLWFVCLGFSSALAWSYFGRLDIYAVASGKIQPSGRSKVVQPLEPGKVVAVHVENGSRVSAGDILVELDPTETAADREAQERDFESTSAEAARRAIAIEIARSGSLEKRPIPFESSVSDAIRRREDGVLAADIAQLASARDALAAQLVELVARNERVTMTISARDKLLKVLKERVDIRDALDSMGQGYRAKVIDALQEYERERTSLADDQGQLLEIAANRHSIELKLEETLSQFIKEQMEKLAEAERKRDRLEQDLVKARIKNERTRLIAPITGVVQQLAVTTLGQVVASGQSLMTLVPLDAPVEIEAMIRNDAIGFVRVGQHVTIKVDAFPFTRYGTLEGTIITISKDAVDQKTAPNLSDAAALTKPQGATSSASMAPADSLVFAARIALSRQNISVDGKETRLSPGMAVTAEIKTGERRALDYALSPLREISSASLHER